MKSLELKWGFIIGGSYLIWLYLSYFFGMHTNGLLGVQIMAFISLGITLVGFVFGLRAVQRALPETTWTEGVKSGGLIAGIAALIAVLAQVGYFTIIHPAFPEVMAEEYRPLLERQNLSADDLASALEAAKVSFGMKAYLIKAGTGMFLSGLFFSLIIMAFLRRLAK